MNLKQLKEPFVIILIGPPLSGKSTWIRENFPTTEVISRDETVMEVYGSRNYTEAFKSVDQKEVDKVSQRYTDISISDIHSNIFLSNENLDLITIPMASFKRSTHCSIDFADASIQLYPLAVSSSFKIGCTVSKKTTFILDA